MKAGALPVALAVWLRPFDRAAVHIFRLRAPDAPGFQYSEEFHLGSAAAVPQKPSIRLAALRWLGSPTFQGEA
jgi:hypothetical protein